MSLEETEIEVNEAKGVTGGVVNRRVLNEDWLQSQSVSAPNPQNLKSNPVICCSRMISFA